jgi:2,5-diamino-6-(ribosylamino)-4(3H)-pyrimidinone 5'-phosphate reductase
VSRPRVVTHAVASVDGRLTLAPDVLLLTGDERWFDFAGESEEVSQLLKSLHQPQVILEGSGSLVLDGAPFVPLPAVDGDPAALYQDFLPTGVVHRPDQRGWFTVVDSRGRVRWKYKEWPGEEWAGWHLLVLVAKATPSAYLRYLQRDTIPYLVAGDDRVDLHQALEKLGAQLEVSCVLCEAGGRLNGALLRAGLVDEVNVELVPAIVGGTRTPSLFDSPDLAPDEWPTHLELISAQVQAKGRIWLRYRVVRE